MCRKLFLVLFVLSCAAQGAIHSLDHPEKVSTGLQRPHRIDLGGEWHFKTDPDRTGEEQTWFTPGSVRDRKTLVPLPWQLAFFEGLEEFDYVGTAWYEKDIEVPAAFQGKRVALGSNGIGNEARIWINGKFAGEAIDVQQTPFLIDVTEHIRPGKKNTITIEATDPEGGMLGSWTYNRASGLWKEIWLEATGRSFISDLHVLPDIDRSKADVEVTFYAERGSVGVYLNLVATSPSGKKYRILREVGTEGRRLPAFFTTRLSLKISSPELWELDDPNLYSLNVTLENHENQTLDTASVDFGMRKIETRRDQVYLNSKPVYLLGGGLDPGPYGGALDVNFHLPPPYLPLDDAQVHQRVEQIKSLGFNFVRCTLRPVPKDFLKWADRLGLFVWSEWPWYRTEAADAQGNPSQEVLDKWAAIALRDRNSPSLLLWGMFNEGLPVPNPEHFLRRTYDYLKSLNPDCLLLDSSGGQALSSYNFPENHILSDIDDVHWYPSFFHFDHVRELIGGIRAYGKPVLVTEFGPIPYQQNVDRIKEVWDGQMPGWASSVASNYAVYGEQAPIEERFDRWNLDKVWGSLTDFTEASDQYYGKGLKHQIELIRKNPEMSGFVTWLYESTPHPTGWIDFFWDKKVFADNLSRIVAQDLVFLDIEGRRNFWSGENVRAEVYLSHFGSDKPLKGKVCWRVKSLGLSGAIGSAEVGPGDVEHIGKIEFRAPEVNEAQKCQLEVFFEARDGRKLENYLNIFTYPFEDRKPVTKRATIHYIFGQRFNMMGYRPPGPVVTTVVDSSVLSMLEGGATVILLACPDMVPGFPHLTYREIHPSVVPFLKQVGLQLGTAEQGAHGDTFYIKKDRGLFSRLCFENPLAWPFRSTWPHRTILGVPAKHESDILAGAFGMMIGSRPYNSDAEVVQSEVNATIAQFKYGKGRLIVSTFNLLNPYMDDPVATIMLNDLIAYANSDFEPGMVLKKEGN